MQQATYTKLKSGNWGVRVAGAAKKGDVVSVTTKAGAVKQEKVAAVLWSGNGITIAAISTATAGPIRRAMRRRDRDDDHHDGGPRGSRGCYMCGSYYCDGARGGLCVDD